jgi:hypothetical protein
MPFQSCLTVATHGPALLDRGEREVLAVDAGHLDVVATGLLDRLVGAVGALVPGAPDAADLTGRVLGERVLGLGLGVGQAVGGVDADVVEDLDAVALEEGLGGLAAHPYRARSRRR